MPQIGWLEILAVVIVAILVLGPKEFPVAIKKIGSYVGKFKNFISNMQNEISSVTEDVDLDIKEVEEKDTEKMNLAKLLDWSRKAGFSQEGKKLYRGKFHNQKIMQFPQNSPAAAEGALSLILFIRVYIYAA